MSAPAAGIRPRVGISACLLGEAVRYDGGHKRDGYLVDSLGAHVEWVPVCPEAELGLGTPRPPIRLEQDGDDVRLCVIATGEDLTGPMARWAADRGAELSEQDLAGFVLKSRSPSCGLGDAPVSDAEGAEVDLRSGAFAHDLSVSWPTLPLASEMTLRDPEQRACFLARVFAFARLDGARGPAAVRAHHERHRLLVASHALDAVSTLDDLADGDDVYAYADGFRTALQQLPARDDHARALRFACMRAGEQLTTAAREQVATVLEAFTVGSASLATAVDVVRDILPDAHPRDAYLRPVEPVWDAYEAL
ncbi:MAG: DUF523 domain-containing protein [Planctomycetota bacterium]|nr:DUF523 domain-containing protein [Planctomycetota bacterium]